MTFENLVTDISLTPNDLRGFIIRLFKEFLKKNFLSESIYRVFTVKSCFLRLKAGIDRTFLGEVTNHDEFIIFRVFTA